MQSHITAHESALLRKFFAIRNNERDIELEFKWQKIESRDVVVGLVRNLRDVASRESHNYITIGNGDNRIVVDMQHKNLLMTGMMQPLARGRVPFTVERKVPYLDNFHRLNPPGTSSKKQPIDNDVLMLADVPIKATLRYEIAMKPDAIEPEKWTPLPKAMVREIQRTSIIDRSAPNFRHDFSFVKMYAWADLLNPAKHESRFEYEIEYIGAPELGTLALEAQFLTALNLAFHQWKKIAGSNFPLGNALLTRYGEVYGARPVFMDAVTLMRDHLSPATPANIFKGYTVTNKADGERVFVLIEPDSGRVILRNKTADIRWTGLAVPAESSALYNSIFDAEYIRELDLLLLFDCLRFAGKSTENLPLYDPDDERPSRLGFVERMRGLFPNIRLKKFVFAEGTAMSEAIREFEQLVLTYDYANDGYIFTPAFEGYGETHERNKWTTLYKWKPAEYNTIDFFVRLQKGANAVAPHGGLQCRLAHVFVSGTGELELSRDPIQQLTGEYSPVLSEKYMRSKIPMLFCPTLPYDEHSFELWLELRDGKPGFVAETGSFQVVEDETVVECKWVAGAWSALRVRADKTKALRDNLPTKAYGNALATAENVWLSIHNPVDMAHLLAGPASVSDSTALGYYNTSVDSRKRGLKLFYEHQNLKKAALYNAYTTPNSTLLEIACGQSGDLNKWLHCNLRSVVATDVDIVSMTAGARDRTLKLKKRPDVLYLHADARKLFNAEAALSPTAARYLAILNGEANGTTDVLSRFANQFNHGIDAISCQFAMHYMTDSEASWENFLVNINRVAHEGTTFFATFLDGQSVYDLLRVSPTFRLADPKNPSQTLALLHREYDDTAVFDGTLGQLNISVQFEGFTAAVVEPLVPFETIRAKMAAAGWHLLRTELFGETTTERSALLTPAELQMSNLYRFAVWKRLAATEIPAETPAGFSEGVNGDSEPAAQPGTASVAATDPAGPATSLRDSALPSEEIPAETPMETLAEMSEAPRSLTLMPPKRVLKNTAPVFKIE